MQKRINITINEELLKQVKQYSELTGIPVSKLIEQALVLRIKEKPAQ